MSWASQEVKFFINKEKYSSKYECVKSSDLYNINDYVGVEIEIEHMPLSDVDVEELLSCYIELVWDGSLKVKGHEIRFTQAIKGEKIVELLNEIEEFVDDYQDKSSKVDGNRASTHIHININDLTLGELYNFVLLSYFMEPYIFSLCKRDRSYNPFVVAESNTRDSSDILNKIKGGDLIFPPERYKYRGIGLNSINTLGSLEFRMFHSTHKATEILGWINLLQRIKHTAKTKNVTEILNSKSIDSIVFKLFNKWFLIDSQTSRKMWNFLREVNYKPSEKIKYETKISNFYKEATK